LVVLKSNIVHSGTNAACVSSTIGSQRLRDFTNWCRQNGKKALLGEFGAGNSDTCLAAIDDALTYMDQNSDVWLGWTWWSAGPWWGNYFMSIEPVNNQDQRQMTPIARSVKLRTS
jgi:endoglucanase